MAMKTDLLAAVTSSVPPRQLPLHDLMLQSIQGHQNAVLHLNCHPNLPLALTVDKSGLAMLWETAPLTALGLLSSMLPQSEAQLVKVGPLSLVCTLVLAAYTTCLAMLWHIMPCAVWQTTVLLSMPI